MIRAIEIENFKCIGERQRIEFAPITLLFGPNSAGKSTVIQALAYLHHLLKRGTIDARETGIRGDNLYLGEYERLLHRREFHRHMRFSLELSGDQDVPEVPGCEEPTGVGLRGAEIAISIRIENEDNSCYSVSLDGIFAGRLRFNIVRGGSFFLESINWYHPRLLHGREQLENVVAEINGKRKSRTRGAVSLRPLRAPTNQADDLHEIVIDNQSLAVHPELGNSNVMRCSYIAELMAEFFDADQMNPDGSLPEYFLSADQFGYGVMKDYGGRVPVPLRSERLRFEGSKRFLADPGDVGEEWQQLTSILTQLFVGSAQLARLELDVFRFGPLRRIPSRTEEILMRPPRELPLRSVDPEPDMWRRMLSYPFADEVNEWLNREDRIDLGISVNLSQAVLLDTGTDLGRALCSQRPAFPHGDEHRQEPWRHTELGELGRNLPLQIQIQLVDSRFQVEVSPEDVGVGVSQVIPIVVHALTVDAREPGISCVEQPELHLHPKAQLALADLFIVSLGEDDPRHTWIIETHSEHLLLRFLRRVRETCGEGLEPDGCPLKPEELSVNYIEIGENGMRARRLHVNEDGDFAGDWPRGFFEERNEELF